MQALVMDIYQVDSFADRLFAGNPAAVCPLADWLDDAVLLAIAAENNLSETAFFVAEGDGFRLRWFTPTVEADLCGHATLAAAWVLFEQLDYAGEAIRFHTRSGVLTVRNTAGGLQMDFPSRPPVPSQNPPAALLPALGLEQAQILEADDYIVVVEHEEQVAALRPDVARLRGLPLRGVAVTAQGSGVDFVSRWFGPNVGIDEDPVTGSAHTALAPYWAGQLGRTQLRAVQGGARKGQLRCQVRGDRVVLSGNVTLYLKGQIHVPDVA